MMTARSFVVVCALALFLAASARGDDKGGEGGPCTGGHWPDDRGCCPDVIKNKPYYRDARKCYPRDGPRGVLYPDSFGCYPDEQGKYKSATEDCPKDRRCEARCIQPRPKYQWDNTKDDREHQWLDAANALPAADDVNPHQPLDAKTKGGKGDDMKVSPGHLVKCNSGQRPDSKGCCPREIQGKWYYRDRHGCYPIQTLVVGHGSSGAGLYADDQGCYPDRSTGRYLKPGEKCPEHRRCYPTCDGGAKH